MSVYQGRMIACLPHSRPVRRAAAALLALGVGVGMGLGGCADMGDTMTTAFADPARYELYDCKQLEPERKTLAARAAELQGLMAKANTGVAGPVVAELAYRNEYIAVRGQTRLASIPPAVRATCPVPPQARAVPGESGPKSSGLP